jgi:hypothetical protein
LHELGHGLGEHADLELGVGVEAEVEEVEEVVQVDLPDPLGVQRDREDGAGELAGDPEFAGEALVVGVDLVVAGAQEVLDLLAEVGGQVGGVAALAVGGRLQGDVTRGRARRTRRGPRCSAGTSR